jgi:hypothetical protein
MTITHQDAAEALQLIETAKRRSIELRGYQSASPHLVLWGVLWGLGYALSYFFPRSANWIWLAIVAGGWSVDFLISRNQHHQATDKRFLGLLMTLFLFAVASIIVMAPDSPNQVAAFIPMIVATCYIALGLYGLPRLFVTGIAVFLLTLIGYFTLSAIFPLWMAAVGGGALVLGGLWLRRA